MAVCHHAVPVAKLRLATVWNQWRCQCFQVVANQIDLWSWFAEFAIPIGLENFGLVAAAVASVAVAEQVVARLIESVHFAVAVQVAASQIDLSSWLLEFAIPIE